MQQFWLKVEHFWLSTFGPSKGCGLTYETLLIPIREAGSYVKQFWLRDKAFLDSDDAFSG